MFAIGMAIVIAAGLAAFAAARRLSGEGSSIGGYFVGFATGSLVVLLYLAGTEVPDENLRAATMVCLLELAAFGPFLGVCAAKIFDAKSAQLKSALKRARPAVASGNMH